MRYSVRLVGTLASAALLAATVGGCGDSEREPVLPEPDSVVGWFGESADARLNGNVLEIRGTVDPEFLRRGGNLWRQASPYFYIFNVKIRDVLTEYPDLAAVRAITVDGSGDEVARATLHSRALNEYEWRDAVALTSLAQREGTESPRRLAALIRFGEEHTEYEYE